MFLFTVYSIVKWYKKYTVVFENELLQVWFWLFGIFGAIFAGTYDYKYTKNILHIKSDEQMVVHVDRQAACQ